MAIPIKLNKITMYNTVFGLSFIAILISSYLIRMHNAYFHVTQYYVGISDLLMHERGRSFLQKNVANHYEMFYERY